MSKRFFYFLVINFVALGLGGIFTGPGVSSEWYTTMNQAPWTPPGWFFGVAWTTIMILLAVFMDYATQKYFSKIVYLYSIQIALNVMWNPVFFYFQEVLGGLIVILSLTVVVGMMRYSKIKKLGWKAAYILPYFVWLVVASSLNAYFLLAN